VGLPAGQRSGANVAVINTAKGHPIPPDHILERVPETSGDGLARETRLGPDREHDEDSWEEGMSAGALTFPSTQRAGGALEVQVKAAHELSVRRHS
jgi:hypothetical protein